MKKCIILFVAFTIIASYSLIAQVSVNTDGSSADSSAILDLKSTNRGFLAPRMTEEQRDAISSPAEGLIIFNTATNGLNFYAAGYWYEILGVVDPNTVTNPTTHETWMDRNLGASRVATSSDDTAAYGDLYQWGRATEGHQNRSSDTTSTNATTAVPNAGNIWDSLFILTDGDWLITINNNLWQGLSGINNPCPNGFRLPTQAEWDAERLSWVSNDASGAFGSPLKLTAGGYRPCQMSGGIYNDGSKGYYWSSTVGTSNAYLLYFEGDDAWIGHTTIRGYGQSIRCIKD